MKTATYSDLNAQLNMPVEGKINIRADKQAARAYHLEEINPHTRFFHDLEEKARYMVENEYWARETVEIYPFDKFKALFKRAYAHKFRFQTLLGAEKFYQGYALKEVVKAEDGTRSTTYLERFEDRVTIVAIHLSQGDYQQAQDLVDIIIDGRFQPATPTFLNAGRAKGGELVSCFLLRIEDNMESIGRSINSSLQLSKRGGGVGLLLTNIRESGAPIKGVPDTSSGIVPVMKILEDSFSYANQLGQRQGAGAVYLNAHHPDIMTFLDTKRENADEKIRIKTLSLGVVIPDITFHLAKENKDMYLFSPYDVERVEGKPFADLSVTEHYHEWVEDDRIAKTKVRARDFFRTLSELQFESGYPYCLFEDTANRHHTMKHAGRINMSNLCQVGSSRINTSKGYRRLDDLYETQEEIEVVVDERARTLDLTNKGVSVQVSSKMFKTAENAEVYRIKTREGFENISTLWHKYYVYRDGNLIKIPLAEVVPGDKFPVQSEKSPSFGLVNDVETAYLAGAYASDGNLTRRSENHIMSTIDLFGGKQEYMERIEDYAEKSIERHGVKGTGMESPKFQDSGDGGVRMYSANLAKAFVLAGVNERDNTEVPEFVFQGTEETVKAYLSGRLAFDGSVYSCTPGSWTFSITSINEKSLRDMQKLLLSLGVYSRIYKVSHAGDSHVQVDNNGKEVVWKHSDSSRLIVTGWDSCNILEGIVDFKASHKATIEEAKQKCKVTRSSRHNHMATVESIEFYGIEDVYDVTVDNGHSVIFDGIATGNCSEISQLNTPSVLNDDLGYETVGADISCNLGSLNVKKMLDLTREEFVDTVQVAVRALTAVSRMTEIDSVPSVREGNNRSRSIGLGQMNLHGALSHHGLRYGSEEALALWDNYMALVTWAAMCESAELSREIGETPYFDGSTYDTGEWWDEVPKAHLERAQSLEILPGLEAPDKDDWNNLHIKVSQYGLANAYLQTIPPTGSISYINNSTSSIHPIAAKVEKRKEGKVGRVYYPAPHMTSENLHLYEDAFEVGPERIIDTYAVSQQWVDQSQSLTLFFADTATTRDLDRARIYAWRKGIKSLYYIRLRQIALEGTGVKETDINECEACQL